MCDISEYPIRMQLRIDWSEVDCLGHVNNLAIMRYVQTARVDFLEKIGMMAAFKETRIGPVMASVSCQFKKQLFYPGNVTVCSRVDHIKTTSFQILNLILDDAGDVVAEAKDVVVICDFNKGVKHPIPEEFRAKLDSWNH